MAGGGKTGAWSALYLDKGQWIQIDLDDIAKVTKVGTQGRQDMDQRVTEYTVSYSLDGGFYTFFKQANNDVVRVSFKHKYNFVLEIWAFLFGIGELIPLSDLPHSCMT